LRTISNCQDGSFSRRSFLARSGGLLVSGIGLPTLAACGPLATIPILSELSFVSVVEGLVATLGFELLTNGSDLFGNVLSDAERQMADMSFSIPMAAVTAVAAVGGFQMVLHPAKRETSGEVCLSVLPTGRGDTFGFFENLAIVAVSDYARALRGTNPNLALSRIAELLLPVGGTQSSHTWSTPRTGASVSGVTQTGPLSVSSTLRRTRESKSGVVYDIEVLVEPTIPNDVSLPAGLSSPGGIFTYTVGENGLFLALG
jgi:hypothetical protein